MAISNEQAQELARDISVPLNSAGAAFYFDPSTLKRGKELGLDGMRFYVLGRGGVLGDVDSDVVTSAFGYFHRDSIAKLWNSAKETLAPREAGRIYMECCAQVGRDRLGDLEGLDGFIDAAETVVNSTRRAGLALFSGIAAEPLVDDAPGRAMQLAAVLRELRGSAHINALLATGVVPEAAHAVKRPEMVETFGWDDMLDVVTAIPETLDMAEELTDRMVAVGLTALEPAQADALRSTSTAMADSLAS